ncbi:hypothetical protein FRC02_006588 [Tulasnella sp. 418]|nr:hypothetical protein FRC02_006588 [Tulasnella sp. 418]
MTGRLWACIDTDLLQRKSITEPSYLIDKLLKKSKNAPLDIKLRFREENLRGVLWLLDRVGPHSHRWRSFISSCVVQLPTSPPWLEAVEESMRRLCGMSAPQLREFDVSFMDERSLPKLSKLFDDFAPRLQWLNIIGIPISWDSPILSGLTRLGLSAWNGISTPTVDQYLRVLLSCPMLESLEIKGRRIDCTRDNLDAVFYHSIPLPNLTRLILDHLHPSTVRSLLSSIKADFKVLETTFGGIPTEKCQDVISSVFLNRHARHFLHSFAISESQVCIESLNSGSCVVFEVSIGSERHEMFNCTFTNVMTPMPLYRTLLPPSTRATICDLFLHATVGNSLFTEDFGPRELFTELKELRVLTLLDQNSDPWVTLESLSKPVSETNSGRRWLCPHLHDLSIEFATFGIDHLWEFLESRYIGDDPPTSLSRLGVLWNDYYDEITDIPIDVASKVVQLVGMDVFSWNSHRFYAGKGAWIRMY